MITMCDFEALTTPTNVKVSQANGLIPGKITLKQKYPKEYVASEYRDEAARIKFSYGFASPELVDVHQEFLVYDTIGMIGSVGGTLGMCIGFSFTSSISFLLNAIKKLNLY